MKKLSACLLLGFALLLNACTKDNSLDQIAENSSPDIQEDYISDASKRQILVDLGFPAEEITEFADYFLIHDDLVVYKEGIDENLTNPLAEEGNYRQLRSSVFVNENIVTNIRVWVDPTFNAAWTTLIQNSLTAWNNAGSLVNFQINPVNPHIRIFVDSNPACPASHRNLSSNTCGRGSFPSGGNPGNLISINTNSSFINTNAKRLRTITHEFGHNIGIMHTNQGSGTQIPYTPTSDANSLMNGGECGRTITLSANDIRAVQIMYSAATWTRAGVDFNYGGWHIGDFNGDGRDDIFRYRPGISGADMFLSNGNDFIYNGSWTGAGTNFSQGGWHIGDFNGDGRDDIFRYRPGSSGADMFLSTGSSFNHVGSWTGAGVNFSQGGWHIGDFNGDGRDDIFRYRAGSSGADMFLSTGSSFNHVGSWTGAGVNFSQGGWHIGDFNGDGRDDIFRYRAGSSGADMFLSTGSSFNHVGSWTGAGVNFSQGGWHIGDFNGGGRDDIFRYVATIAGADMFLSNGSVFTH